MTVTAVDNNAASIVQGERGYLRHIKQVTVSATAAGGNVADPANATLTLRRQAPTSS